ncbi:MAG: diacylglycerol/lipid kinase family protein [Alphaproteobacteria bacterium]
MPPAAIPETPRRLYVIYNPVAGWCRRRYYARVLAALSRLGCQVRVRETAARGDAEAFARAADPRTCDLVVAAGGDGTINEVINGLRESAIPLALLPLGTANVLAAEIGLAGGARALAETIARGATRPVFLGSANGRRFALMIGVGFDARVVEGLDLRLKRALGKLAYGLAALGRLCRYRAERYQVEIDGVPFTAAALVIAKGHYYGGRFVVAAHARLDEPRLHVALFERAGRWNLVRYAWALLAGRMDHLKDVRIVEGCSVAVRGRAGEAVQADGDLVACLPLAVTLAEEPLALVTAG